MKIMKIIDKHSLTEIMQINYEFWDVLPEIVAMYAMLSMVMLKENNIEVLLTLLLEMRADNMEEQEMLILFLHDYTVKVEDVNDTITKAESVSDIFGK